MLCKDADGRQTSTSQRERPVIDLYHVLHLRVLASKTVRKYFYGTLLGKPSQTHTPQSYLILSCLSHSFRVTAPLCKAQIWSLQDPAQIRNTTFQYAASNNTFVFLQLFISITSITLHLLYNLSRPPQCQLFHIVYKTPSAHLLIFFPN